MLGSLLSAVEREDRCLYSCEKRPISWLHTIHFKGNKCPAVCYSVLRHNPSLPATWLSQALCFSPGSSFIYPLVHHFSKCGHAVGDTECLSALGETKNQQKNVSLTGVPIRINHQMQEMAKQKSFRCIKSTLSTRGCLPASVHLHLHLHEPKVSKCTRFLSLYSCTSLYLGCIWLPEIRAADIKMFITNLQHNSHQQPVSPESSFRCS